MITPSVLCDFMLHSLEIRIVAGGRVEVLTLGESFFQILLLMFLSIMTIFMWDYGQDWS